MPQGVERKGMLEAIKSAVQGITRGHGGPFGACLVRGRSVVAVDHNRVLQCSDATAHAEMLCLTAGAGALENWRLADTTLYCTLEPCCMCAGAILNARIPQVIYGATNPKAGAVQSLFHLLDDERLNHRCEVVPGILAGPCGEILTQFFQAQRKLGKK